MSVHSTSVAIGSEHTFVFGTEQEGQRRRPGSGTVVVGVALTVFLHALLFVGVTALHGRKATLDPPEDLRIARPSPLMVELYPTARPRSGGGERLREPASHDTLQGPSAPAPPRRSHGHARPRTVSPTSEAPAPPEAEAPAPTAAAHADETGASATGSGAGEGATAVGGIAGTGSASTGKCCGHGPGGDGAPAAAPTIRVPARPIYNPRPVYPRQARLMGWEGSVVLHVLVDAQGGAAEVTVAAGSGQPVLDASAVEAVRRWRFSPALEAGKPVTRVHDVRIRFRLDDYPA